MLRANRGGGRVILGWGLLINHGSTLSSVFPDGTSSLGSPHTCGTCTEQTIDAR